MSLSFLAVLCFSLCLASNNRKIRIPQSRSNLNNANDQNTALILQQIFSYLTDEDLSLLSNSTNSSCMSINDMFNINKWKYEYDNNILFKHLLLNKQSIVREECGEMNLTTECFEDCVYYNDVFSWILILFAGNATEIEEVIYMITLYSMSAGPFSYYDVGNPDMCIYSHGTYCYTPAMADTFPLTQHACCLPASCSGDNAIRVLNSNTWCYEQYYNIYGNISEDIEVLNICEPIPRELNQFGVIIVFLIFFVFLLLVLTASILKQFFVENTRFYNVNNDDVTKSNLFVSSFNIQDIWKSFKSVRPKDKTQYNFLDGIRVWSMSWVIFGHSFLYFLTGGASNLPTLLPLDNTNTSYKFVIQEFYMIFAEYGFYSVDSFFFLSGFLGTFSIYRQIKKYPGRKAINLSFFWIPLAYVSRILRIVPMMMYTTAIQWQLQDQMSTGYHVTSRNAYTDYCDHGWYKILLFYANLQVSNDNNESLQCMGHLWYIQCDMQMFLLLPFILLCFAINKLFGLIFAIVPILISIIIRIYYGFYYDFSANVLYPAYPTKNGGEQQADSYYQPWTRMSVYFIGVALMLLIIVIDEEMKRRKTKFILPKSVYFLLLTFGCFILASLVIWPYQDIKDAPEVRWSLLSNQIYYALGRPAWGFGLAILTFCLKYKESDKFGQKSIIKSFLSLEIYQQLGKLTYLMYLMHLIIFSWWALDLELPAYYDEWTEILLVISVWFITAFFSILLWFIMEKPISNLVTAFLKWIATISDGSNKKKQEFKNDLNQQLIVEQNQYSLDGANDKTDNHLIYDDEQTLKEHTMTDSSLANQKFNQ